MTRAAIAARRFFSQEPARLALLDHLSNDPLQCGDGETAMGNA
jgi:hypothetical protein